MPFGGDDDLIGLCRAFRESELLSSEARSKLLAVKRYEYQTPMDEFDHRCVEFIA